ncbi:flagellar basal body rod protein FlgB [Natranaerofaba carboxydovora]|uniref:flagellar basal body rod protein FlgB n=1 Tax=Natranaerofaba carboxydovora TaxID=2742683 RepID=UPI001F135284|nr:flagellar basal body rod protein FlgB [Natranaerofaba carboxydovora]UMZ73353.1 Flagellar basal body rod protein FlgB [Natranaerofaba carboxydovora]
MKIDNTSQVLESAIGAAHKRDQVISDNIANVNTPGYKRGRVSFEEQLKKALSEDGIKGKTTREKHIPIGEKSLNEISPKVVRDSSQFMRNDGNNVDIDVEMAELSKNTLHQGALVRQLNSKLGRLRSVIQDGG